MKPRCERPKCRNQIDGRSRLCRKHREAFNDQQRAANPLFRVLVDATRSVEHIHALHDAGIGWPRIAHLTGVKSRTLRSLVEGRRQRIYATTEAALLSVPVPDPERVPDFVADGALVPNVGTLRRLRALIALGYTNERIAAEMGMPRDHFTRLLDGSRTRCLAGTARRAADVFARLEETEPPDTHAARRARTRAQRRGWLPPIVWNPDTIDDADAQPEVRKKQHPFRIPPYFAEEYIEYRDLVGLDDAAIAERFGICYDTLLARLRRRGITPQNPPLFTSDDEQQAS